MGRRKKEKGRAKKRTRETTEELVERAAERIETKHISDKPNEDLFILDTTADPALATATLLREKKKRKKALSHVDQEKINRLLEKHTSKELIALVTESKQKIIRAKKERRTLGSVRPKFDLWDTTTEEEETKSEQKSKDLPNPGIGMSLAGTAPAHVQLKPKQAMGLPKNYRSVAIEVANAGQSYKPDQEQHQNIIGEALALELRRKEIEEYNAKPVGSGMSERTKELLLGSSDEEEEDDDEEDQQNNDDDILKRRPKGEKLTRAMRNKQKRHRALLYEIKERKRERKFINSLSDIKKINRELRKKETTSKERKDALAKLKEESRRTLGKGLWAHLSKHDPQNAPTFPVGLTSELKNSTLRSIKPKGSLLTDRLESFRDRKMTDPKQVGDKKRVVQGRRRVKVKGEARKRGPKPIRKEDGGDFLLMA